MEIWLLAIKTQNRFDTLASASQARLEIRQKVVACIYVTADSFSLHQCHTQPLQ